MEGLIGRKMGMTQVYDERGHRIAVTVIEAGPCVVVQHKTMSSDGYEAIQLAFADQKEKRVSKAALGRFNKAGTTPKRCLKEFSIESGAEVKEGDAITLSIFDGVSHVDVEGRSKGRGFAGVVKRHGMAGGRMTHGGHSKRRVGSIGQCSYPARVAKGQRMPGHMGSVRVTQQNLKIVQVRHDDNILLVQGAIPGPTGGIVIVRKAFKKVGRGL